MEIITTLIPLFILIALGWFARRNGFLPPDFLGPALIILSTPTATVTYVMSREMTGHGDFAASAISTSTILCALTFTLWLHFAL